jgi:hypothetical protein
MRDFWTLPKEVSLKRTDKDRLLMLLNIINKDLHQAILLTLPLEVMTSEKWHLPFERGCNYTISKVPALLC